MKLSQPQKTVAKDEARFKVLVSGRRFGKTTLAIRELCYHARHPNTLCWYVAPSYRQAKQIAWTKLKKILMELRWAKRFNEADLTCYLKNGSQICLRGADNPDSLRGVGINYLVLDETADISEQSWTEVLRPTLSDTKGKAIFLGTPKGHNWFYDLYQRGRDQNEQEWSSHLYTTEQGGWVDADEIEQAKRDLSAKVFRQEYQATWETYSGLIFYSFDMERNVQPVSITEEDKMLYVGVDFNIDPISAVVATIKNDVIKIVDEIRIFGSNTDELCSEIHNRYPNKKIMAFPDPSCVQRKTSAGGKTDLSILQNAGFVCKLFKSHMAVRDRINSVNSKLCNANDQRMLFIDPKCKNLLNTLTKQTYKEGTSVPDKSQGLDHLGDALGYLVSYLYPITRNYKELPAQRYNVQTRMTYGRI
jgi:phage terminase large subunit